MISGKCKQTNRAIIAWIREKTETFASIVGELYNWYITADDSVMGNCCAVEGAVDHWIYVKVAYWLFVYSPGHNR